MKASARVEYGMPALTDNALNSENGTAVPAPEFAERQDSSRVLRTAYAPRRIGRP